MSKTRLIAAFASILIALLLASCATTPPASKRPLQVADPVQLRNPKAGFAVKLRADHEPLRIGDYLELNLHTMSGGYMNLYVISSSGQAAQLLTNYPVRASETVEFPPTTNRKTINNYVLTPPPGLETYMLVVTRQPLNLLGRQDIKNIKKPRTPVAELNMTGPQLVDRLRTVLRRQPPQTWNADSIRLQLAPPDVAARS